MAEDKRGILVYSDWIDKFEELTDDEAGKLIKHFFRYVNDLDPVAPDRTTKLLFIDIKNHLKRDLSKWENIKEKRSEAGKKGGIKSGQTRKTKQNEAKKADVLNTKQTLANEAVNVNVNVNDNVSVNNIVVEEVITGEDFSEETKNEKLENIPAEFILNEEEYAAAEKYLKSQNFFSIIKMQQKLDDALALKYFRIFYEQKSAFDQLKNHRTQMDLLKNFFYWIPKYKNSLIDNQKKQSNGNANTNQRASNTSTPTHVSNRAERNELIDGIKSVLLGAQINQ